MFILHQIPDLLLQVMLVFYVCIATPVLIWLTAQRFQEKNVNQNEIQEEVVNILPGEVEYAWLQEMLISPSWMYKLDYKETAKEIIHLWMTFEFISSPYSVGDLKMDEDWLRVRLKTYGLVVGVILGGDCEKEKLKLIRENLPFIGGRGNWVLGWDRGEGERIDFPFSARKSLVPRPRAKDLHRLGYDFDPDKLLDITKYL